MIAYITGFFLVGNLSDLPTQSIYFPLALLVTVLCLVEFKYRGYLISIALSCSFAINYGHYQLDHRLNIHQRFMNVEVAGVVTGLPQLAAGRWQFMLRLDRPLLPPLDRLRTLKLSLYDPTVALQSGDRLEASVTLKPVHGQYNPSVFDYERWALVQGVDATGYVKSLRSLSVYEGVSIDRIRSDIERWLEARFASNPLVVSTLSALLIGDKSQLEDWQWELLRQTGTTHLMVVSGLHIGICVFVGWWIGRLLSFLLFRGHDHKAYYHLPIVCSLLISAVYVALAGFSVPTQRAWLMAACLLIGKVISLKPNVWQRWWLAMALVLTLQPLALFEQGFWLSFMAVGSLLLLVSLRKQGYSGWSLMISSQSIILFVLGPFLLYFFGFISLASPVINFFAIPIMSIVLAFTPLALMFDGFGFAILLDLLVVGIDSVWGSLQWLSEQTSRWQFEGAFVVSNGWLLIALLGAVLVIQPIRHSLRILGVICWLAVVFQTPAHRPVLSIWVLDVGQGNSLYVETAKHNLLYDTGAKFRSGTAVFSRAVEPFLRNRGVSQLDKLILSHADNDHAGGYKEVIEALSVRAVESGMPEAFDINVGSCRSGGNWEWDAVTFKYVQPLGSQDDVDNDRSCMLLIESSGCSLLITGDASISKENDALVNLKSPVFWLVAGHHGSRTSTGEMLLSKVQPKEVIVSAGFLNQYNHPHPSVVERIHNNRAALLRTDQLGAIHLFQNEIGECHKETWREKEKRYWTVS